jgi:hypothetical protein
MYYCLMWYLCRYGILEVEVNLRPTVSRPVCPGVRRLSGTRDQFFFLLEIFFRELLLCYFVAPSLKRGRVCNLLYNCFWALPEQSLLGWSPTELMTIFTVSSETSSTWRARFPYFYPPGTGWPRYTPGHWVPFPAGSRIYIPQKQGGPVIPQALGFLSVASYDSQGYGGSILSRLHTGLKLLKSKAISARGLGSP